MEEKNILKTGTTTLGIVCRDSIVLAADKRATAGTFVVDKKTDKIHAITNNIAVTMAGMASDGQLLVRLAQSELRLKKIRVGRETTVKEAANLMSRMVYSNVRQMSMVPGISHFVLGGVDKSGFFLYDLFPDGSISLCDKFVSSGSGSVMAYGVLETNYKKDMTVEEGVKMAVTSINAALQRDSATGNGIDVVVIKKEGVKKILEKELDMRIKV